MNRAACGPCDLPPKFVEKFAHHDDVEASKRLTVEQIIVLGNALSEKLGD